MMKYLKASAGLWSNTRPPFTQCMETAYHLRALYSKDYDKNMLLKRFDTRMPPKSACA